MAADPGSVHQQSCRDTFRQCTMTVGKSAEDSLIDAIDDCEARYQGCQSEGSKSGFDECGQTLRVCIGDASMSAQTSATGGAAALKASPPTYQCFGQLRQCVADSSAPQRCAQEARSCLTAAAGEASTLDYQVMRGGRGGTAAAVSGSGGMSSPGRMDGAGGASGSGAGRNEAGRMSGARP